jgi:hypothetical protein
MPQKYKYSINNIENGEITDSLFNKYSAPFYPSSFFYLKNFLSTNENTLILRKGTENLNINLENISIPELEDIVKRRSQNFIPTEQVHQNWFFYYDKYFVITKTSPTTWAISAAINSNLTVTPTQISTFYENSIDIWYFFARRGTLKLYYKLLGGAAAEGEITGTDASLGCFVYQGRLFCWTPTGTIRFSKAPNPVGGAYRFTDFTIGAAPDDGLEFQISDILENNQRIVWAIRYENIIFIGTTIGIYKINGGSDNSVITPTNINIERLNSISCDQVTPVENNNSVIFVGVDKRLYSFQYQEEQQTFLFKNINPLHNKFLESIIINKLFLYDTNTILMLYQDLENIDLRTTYGTLQYSNKLAVLKIKEKFWNIYKLDIENIEHIRDISFSLFTSANSDFKTDQIIKPKILLSVRREVPDGNPDKNYFLELDLETDYFKDRLEFDTQENYREYLNDYRKETIFLDSYFYYSGAISFDGDQPYFTIANILYHNKIIYINREGIIYGPLSVNGSGRVDLLKEYFTEVTDSFYYGFYYEALLKKTDIENVENINAVKNIYRTILSLYYSGTFLLSWDNEEYKSFETLVADQNFDTNALLYYGRYDLGVLMQQNKRIWNLYIKNKPAEMIHLAGLEYYIKEHDD